MQTTMPFRTSSVVVGFCFAVLFGGAEALAEGSGVTPFTSNATACPGNTALHFLTVASDNCNCTIGTATPTTNVPGAAIALTYTPVVNTGGEAWAGAYVAIPTPLPVPFACQPDPPITCLAAAAFPVTAQTFQPIQVAVVIPANAVAGQQATHDATITIGPTGSAPTGTRTIPLTTTALDCGPPAGVPALPPAGLALLVVGVLVAGIYALRRTRNRVI